MRDVSFSEREIWIDDPSMANYEKLAQSGGFDVLIPSTECTTSSSYSFI